MIEAGESLGPRYVVARPPERTLPGTLFEVSERAGTPLRGQLLAEAPVTPAQANEVRLELARVPALPHLLRPREIVLSPRGVPVAVLERPGVEPLRDRVKALADSLGKRALSVELLRAVASVAADLAQVHRAGVVHGAITSESLLSNPRNESERCLLSAFGIHAFSRRRGDGLGPERTPRSDLVELLGALHDLFVVSGSQPEGSAQAKWTLLRHSSLHGEHPALASGTALATALNEIAALPSDDEPPRPARSTLPPGRVTRATLQGQGPMAVSGAPPANPSASAATRGSSPSIRVQSPSIPLSTRPPASAPPRFSLKILVAGGLAIGLIAVAAGFYAWDATKVTAGRTGTWSPRRITGPRLECPGESVRPVESLRADEALHEFDFACVPGAPRLTLVHRSGTTLRAGSRPAVRGGHLPERPVTVAQGAVELGSVLARGDADWVSWRNGLGAPIGLARVDARGAAQVSVPLEGWDLVPLRGAHLVWVTEREAFIVTNVESERGAHAVLIDVALPPGAGRSPAVTWYLGTGAVEAVIPGETPTLLLHAKEGLQHTLTAVSVRLSALSSGRAPNPPTSVRGAALPESAVSRSLPLSLAGEVLVSAPRGLPRERAFLVTVGSSRPRESCANPSRCVSSGKVSLLRFPEADAPNALELAPNAWGEDLVEEGPDEGLSVLLVHANVAGAPSQTHVSINVRGADVSRRAVVTSPGRGELRVGLCGDAPWAVFPVSSPEGVGTLPLACLRRP